VRRLPPPWQSEEAAFQWLLRVVAVFAVIALLSVVLKALLYSLGAERGPPHRTAATPTT
jgi:hypothetical protein